MRWEIKRLFVRAGKNFGTAFSELFSDLGSATYELFIQIPKDIKTFFQNIWAYKGLLWEDRNWDHSYILRLLELKIRRTKEHINEHKRHTRYKLDVKNMQKAEDMIKMILEDDSAKDLWKAHDEKWGKAQSAFIKVPGSSCSEWRTLRLNARTPEQQKQETKEYRALLTKSTKLEEKTWSRLWQHLDKHMRSWWD